MNIQREIQGKGEIKGSKRILSKKCSLEQERKENKQTNRISFYYFTCPDSSSTLPFLFPFYFTHFISILFSLFYLRKKGLGFGCKDEKGKDRNIGVYCVFGPGEVVVTCWLRLYLENGHATLWKRKST